MTLDREIIWAAATDAGDRSMRAGARKVWSNEDWNAMVSEFDRLCPEGVGLEKIETPKLRAEVNRRLVRDSPKPKKMLPCIGCGAMLSACERRKPCPNCGARNPRKAAQS